MSDFDGFDLDQATDRAWTQLQDRLADHLLDLDGDDYLVVGIESGGEYDDIAPYVQFAVDEDTLHFEVSSNEFLTGIHRLDDRSEQALLALGLEVPSRSADDHESDGSPNFHLAADQDDAGRLAVLAVRALRDVFSVPHPAFLQAGPLFDGDTDEDPRTDDDLDPNVAVLPQHRAHLQSLVDRTLLPVFGHVPEHDDDGDIPVVSGSSLVFVRVLDGAPIVQLFASVVEAVSDLDRATFEVGVLNRDSGFIRYALLGDRVMAFLQIPARPFVPAHLRGMLDLLSRVADEVDDDLAVRVAGRPTFETGSPHTPATDTPRSQDGWDHGELHPAMATLLELDAEEPGSVDPELAASICGHDRELILRLITESSEQEIVWRERREQALIAGAPDEAEVVDHEMRHAERTSSLLRRALRVVVEAEQAARRLSSARSQRRYRRSSSTDETPSSSTDAWTDR